MPNKFFKVYPFFLIVILQLDVSIISSEVEIEFCYKGTNCFEINDFTFDQKWKNHLQNKLNEVTSLTVTHLKLSQQNYFILFSHRFSNLKKIKFTNSNYSDTFWTYKVYNTLTPKLIKTIFTSQYFEQLEQLDLSRTYVEFRHFQFFEQINSTIKSNLRKLILNDNYLQKRAFKLLQKVNFQGKLEVLELAGNSLIDHESINSILKIIKPHDNSKPVLKTLNVYSTSIPTDHLILLLENISVQNLQHFSIGHNAFQHSTNYQIPFNNTLFQYLSDCQFSSLKSLNLSHLDLDDEQLPYLRKMKLPLLQNLDIGNNFLTDDYFIQWIVSENMPLLQKLNITKNSITDKSIQLLVQQNFIHLRVLDLSRNRKLSSHHLTHLSLINSSQWTHLDLSENCVNQKSLRNFFENRSFGNLLELKMQYLSNNVKKLLEFMNLSSMKNLQNFEIFQTDISQSINVIVQKNVTFPNLKVWRLGGLWFQRQHMDFLMRNITAFGPELKQLEVKISSHQDQGGYFNLTLIDFDTVPKNILLKSSQFMSIFKPENGRKFEIIDLFTVKYENKSRIHDDTNEDQPKPEMKNMFDVKFFGRDSKQINESNIQATAERTFEFLSQFVDFSSIETFWYSNRAVLSAFMKTLLKQLTEQKFSYSQEKLLVIKNQGSAYLPYMRVFTNLPYYQSQTQDPQLVSTLIQLRFPLLNAIFTDLLIDEKNSIDPNLINKFLLNHPNINFVMSQDNRIDCDVFDKIFENVTLNYLVKLKIAHGKLREECLQKLISNHRLIKQLNVKNSTLLSDGIFDQILLKHDLLLDKLGVGIIQLQDEGFSKLSKMNRQFINYLDASLTGLTSEGLKYLSKNVSQSGQLFPKMRYLDLYNNFFDQNGSDYLFSRKMPFLQRIWYYSLSDYLILNKFFEYPSKKKFCSILAGYLHNIQPKYDKRALRHVENLVLESAFLYFEKEDYQILAETDLGRLRFIDIVLKDIFECEYLKSVLQIIQHVEQMHMTFLYNKVKNLSLSDSCLSNLFPLSQPKMTHLKKSKVQIQRQKLYIPLFYALVYATNFVSGLLNFSQHSLTDPDMIRVLEHIDINEIMYLDLNHNYLTDAFAQKLFEHPLNKTKIIVLNDNQLKLKDVPALKGKTFHQLESIYFALNQLTDQSIELLTQANFPKLTEISFESNSLTLKGFMNIMNLKAPNLKAIVLNNCLVDEEDLVYFVQYANFQKFPFLTKIITNIRVQQINSRRIKQLLDKKYKRTKLEIVDNKYHLKQQNKVLMIN